MWRFLICFRQAYKTFYNAWALQAVCSKCLCLWECFVLDLLFDLTSSFWETSTKLMHVGHLSC